MSRWYTGFLWYIYSHMVVCLGKIWSTQLNFILFVGSLESAPGWPTRVTLPTSMAETPRRKWKKDLGQGRGQIVAVEPLVLGEGLTLGGIGAGPPQMIINSYNISKNMEFLKSSYFQTVPHNGLGYQLSLIMVSQPNHLLRECFGSIGMIYIITIIITYNSLTPPEWWHLPEIVQKQAMFRRTSPESSTEFLPGSEKKISGAVGNHGNLQICPLIADI